MSRADDFNRITKGVQPRVLARAFNVLTPGLDWRGSGRPAIRDFYTGADSLSKERVNITAANLEASIAAEQATSVTERNRLLALIDQRDAAPEVGNG